MLAKGEPDPRVGDPVVDGRGGPDLFGHQWIDSDETGGPAFQWNDISGVGAPIALEGDDEMSAFVPIGFLFPFYDNLYAHVRVSTNGFLSFSSGTPDWTNQVLPSPAAPENMVAPFWDDLFFSAASIAHAWSDGQRFIVQWSNVDHYGGGGPYTFQAILHGDGTIVYQYLFIGAPSVSATVGIQNAGRNDGLTVAFNNTYVRSGLAVRIQAAPTWLTVSPSAGRLAPGQSMPLTVLFDASHLAGGEYDAVVRLSTNDPDESQTDVSARLRVASAPDISFAFPSVSFLNVFVGSSLSQTVLVSNHGVLPLEVTDLRTNPSVFEVNDAPFTLNPGQEREIEIRFRPSATGPVSGTLTVLSNDPDEGAAPLPLSGTGVLPPDVSVTPPALTASIFTGEVVSREIAIANTGVTALTWRVFPQGATSELETFMLEPPAPQGNAPDGPAVARDPSLARTGSIEASLASLTGVRVLHDTAHGNTSLAAWSRLVQSITQRGATLNTTSAPITPEILSEHDILWITDGTVEWQTSEIAAVTEWLAAGGALLLEGDNPSSVAIYNALLSAAGVALRYRDLAGSSGITDIVYPHAVTRDVRHVNLDSNIATLTNIAAPTVRIVEDVAGTPAGAAATVGTGRILAFSDELLSDFHSSFADNQLLANQAFDWLSGISWVQVSPAQGTTPAGGSSPVTVTLDGAGLAGGEHTAQVIVASNDPDEEEVAIPVSLQVTGAPDIALSRLTAAFGPVFLTGSRADTIRVTNAGTATLVVESIEIGDDEFHVDSGTFELGVGQARPLIFTFTPTRLGPVETTATLRSNDPDEATVTLVLSGEGHEPPGIAVSPDSLSDALDTGETASHGLRIENESGSDLVFHIEIDDPARPEEPEEGAGPGPAITTSWSELRVRAGESVAPIPVASAIPPIDLPVVLRDFGGDGGVSDLTELRASSFAGQLQVEMRFAAPLHPANFGGILSLDIDQNRATGLLPTLGRPEQDIGMEFEIEMFMIPFGVVTLHDRVLGTFVENIPVMVGSTSLQFVVPLASLRNDDGKIDVTGVVGSASGPTDWFPDVGHGLIGGPIWLSADPASGVLPAGTGADVAIRFDASALDGGAYDARIVVESNDPDEVRTEIPVRLAVTPAPVFAVQPSTLEFGTIYVGFPHDSTFTVFNIGSAPLSVESITVDDPSYALDPQTFQVQPLESRIVHVRFDPGVAGAHEANLRVSHDAAGSPGEVLLHGAAVPPPVLIATPRSFAFALESGEEEAQTLALRNGGGSNLVYDFDARTSESTVELQEAMEIPRGTEDLRQGDPVTQRSGGPDAFGYRWTDSDEPGGPVFDWVEISQIGTRLPISDLDDNFGPVPIGFEFPFYGNRFTSFRICTHGWISFTNTAVHFLNQPLPSLGAPENLIAPFWEDLNFRNVERSYVHHDGTRFIIQWNEVPRNGQGGPYTFQILLYPNGTILYQYLTMGLGLNGATVGIQNGNRNDGLQVVFNAAYLHDRMAIRFTPVPTWLQVDPSSGTLPPGASQEVRLTGKARGIFPGDYPVRLNLTTNDPATPEITIPVSFHVTGTPDLMASPDPLAFDTLYVGIPASRDLRITNVGTDRLEVTEVQASRAGISLSPSSLSLGPLQSAVMRVTLLPATAQDLSSTLTVVSNDPDSPAVIPITGIAILPPHVAVEPLPIIAVAPHGGTGTKKIRIRNTGGSDLRWSAGSPVPAPQPHVNHVELPKGVDDMRPGILGTGGPDRFGHFWIDSDHAGGPAFEWEDITRIGVQVPFSPEADDQNRGPFPIGFEFPFYDRSFTQFRVCTNGWISFTNSSVSYLNQPLPSAAQDSPENMVAAMWEDFVLSAVSGAVLFHSSPERLIVQWNNLRPYGGSGQDRYTFQTVLYPNGEIALRYFRLGSLRALGTVGIQNAARNDGLTVAFNELYLHQELAIRMFQRPHWLSVAPPSGVVPAGGSAEVSLTVDASRLEAGEHRASLPLASNDPALPLLAAEVLARVRGVDAAAADVDPNTLNLESGGQYVVGRVELPPPYLPGQIVASTVRWNGTVPVAAGTEPRVADFNENGVPDLELRFDRAAVESVLTEGDPVPITLTGEIHETAYFTARDEIRVIRPRMTAPNGGELLPAGSPFLVRWSNPQGWRVERSHLVVSYDAGETWQMLAENVTGNSYAWTVPHTPTTRAWIRVHAYDAQGAMGYDKTDGAFTIQ
ncbi:MAG TPA: choice-of-anchor D domain-containing protein, partial [Candidatus Eisenbacteria bacterium]|nr:choice-of-anchor D domain-containing protein [Candidatus Eisenbacteria bacterium]